MVSPERGAIPTLLQPPLRRGRSNSMNRDLPFSSNGRPSSKKARSEPQPPDPLLAAYDELNAAWNAAEEDFAAMRVPVRVLLKVSQTSLGDPDGPVQGCKTVYLTWTR